MLNFCTLFDSNYLSRGLAMYYSLEKHCSNFHLYIFAFNKLSYQILTEMQLKHATIISLNEFENETLLQVKPTRSVAEYCWTCTPSTIHYVLHNFEVDNCTYLDADLLFYSSPQVLFDELKTGKNVIITEHRYAKSTELYEQNRGGRFCVQFVTFTKAPDSLAVLETWKNQCLDWCYARYEEGKFGDQKYLDVWPEKYSNVHILEHLGGGLAPWNANNYTYDKKDNLFVFEKGKKQAHELVFYHFHYVHIKHNLQADIGWHVIPQPIKKYIYAPYIKQLLAIETDLKHQYPEFNPLRYGNKALGLKDNLKKYFKLITQYNILNNK